MGACHRAPKQVTALAVHGPRKACGRADGAWTGAAGPRPWEAGRPRGLGRAGAPAASHHFQVYSTSVPVPRDQDRSHSSSQTLMTGRDDGRGRRTKRGTKRARQAANVPRGRAARPGPGARGSHSAPGRRLPSPQTLLMSERRDRPRWGRAGRVRPQGACQASVRPRAAAGRGARRGPPMGGSRDSSLLRRPVLRGTPHCGIQGASDARRWETGRPGEEAAGEPRGQPRGPQALPPPSAPEPGVGAASVALPAGCSGDPGARCPTPAVWRRSSRPQALPPLPGAAFRPLRLDFCVPLCSHRFQQEPSPRPRHRTRPLILGHPGDGRWLGPPQRGAWQAGSP